MTEHTLSEQTTIAGIILAAGTSTRMGKDKLSLPFKGKPLVQHVIDAARKSLLDSAIVVLPENSALEALLDLTDCEVVYSRKRLEGQAESLKTGLQSLSETTQGAMTLLGDLPLLTSDAINHLIHAFWQAPHHWIIPMRNGRRGNPVTIPKKWFGNVLELKGDTGARPLLIEPSLPVRLIEMDEVGPFFDIDTTRQYDLLLTHYDTATK
ncbi:nucleotidyltransferase family protein [Halodesulfovibrio marinisediminis]|uniref:Molybdenum cofactor cytidylyltransferase n=1 Tax=Halodesulfovibrio marinisediminis DSM 17456 TaxID=1121457 RepID=A0A1N6DV49_9BACT|nr:nucleotidyltransferase family protein [Halodesulfovibrio marinisediminis]SIN74593.1 molybdenum cofactor cytidylyltransferase [Halodesulfovibrio marinisediminis DSM 17456]